MKEQQLIIESLLFVASEPLLQSDIERVFDVDDTPSLDDAIIDINAKYSDSAFEVKAVGEGYMLVTKKEFEPFISKYMPTKKLMLSNASLEVLAIVAYKQPISRIDLPSKLVFLTISSISSVPPGERNPSPHTTSNKFNCFGP